MIHQVWPFIQYKKIRNMLCERTCIDIMLQDVCSQHISAPITVYQHTRTNNTTRRCTYQAGMMVYLHSTHPYIYTPNHIAPCTHTSHTRSHQTPTPTHTHTTHPHPLAARQVNHRQFPDFDSRAHSGVDISLFAHHLPRV